MGVPNVDIKTKVGQAMTKALKMTPDQLDKADGTKDGEFDMYRIVSVYMKQPQKIEELRKRIIAPNHRSSRCMNVYFVDNGDGKISAGDLFLHADGYYGERNSKGQDQYAYRLAWLCAPRKV